MSFDKAVQTCEEDIDESVSDSSESEEESMPFYERMDECDQSELVETIYELVSEYIEGYILKMSKPDFHSELTDDIAHVIFQQLSDTCDDIEYSDLHAFVSHYCDLWFKTGEDLTCPFRHSNHHTENAHIREFGLDETFVKEMIHAKIAGLKEKDQSNPKQRTKEWYERRYQMMTASNLWQTLGSDAQKNRFIYDKCKPLVIDTVESKWMSTEGSLHWGVKYEPLTTMVYERLTGARVDLFGCLVHPEHSFLGASPDGIVVNPESPLYGRLVEIKNIYNREMDGIPSEAYWIQIQAQLACCDLDFCDFVETRFKEYDTETDYINEFDEDRLRGIILHMVPNDGKSNIALYQYMPLDTNDYMKWIEETKRDLAETHVTYKTIYWYLDDIQLTTITRNHRWFDAALPVFKDIWTTIQTERISGYEHRAPKKRTPTDTFVVEPCITLQNVCVIKLSEEDTLSD
jgi:putative phage-type endonuclease